MIFITFLQLHVNLQLPPNLKKKSLILKYFQSSSLPIHLGKQQRMVRVFVPLHPRDPEKAPGSWVWTGTAQTVAAR